MVAVMIRIGFNSPKCMARLQVTIIDKLKEYDVDGGNDDKDRLNLPKYTAKLHALVNFGTRRNITSSLSPFVHPTLSCLQHSKK